MHRTIATGSAATLLTGLGLVLGPHGVAAADPKPVDDGIQTSVCDNGETYVFPVISHSADQASSFEHAAVLVPGSNVVLHGISFSGTVSFEVDGVVVDSVPVETSTRRTPNPARTTTCATTYQVTEGPGEVVRVVGTDVFQVSGH